MKRLPPLLVCLALLLSLLPRANAAPNGMATAAVYDYAVWDYQSPQPMPVVRLRLNGQYIEGEMPGVILEGRTLAPLRLLAEALGAQVEWLSDVSQVRITLGETDILLTLGSATALVNGQAVELPDGVPATTLSHNGQGYTVVPLRFFSEALGCRVGWEQGSYTASVFQKDHLASLLAQLDEPVDAANRTIALDAGHGGSASGAYYEETAEKDLNLAMTQKLRELLEALGYNVIMTRNEDVYMDLYDRAEAANRVCADVFVSIHCNADKKLSSFQGLYVYHYPGSEEGAALAQAIQTPACAFTGATDQGIASADFVVVRETDMPAVLVETGFMTCHEELEKLKNEDYQTSMALGIAQGIVEYLNAREK